jgi:hypothetical protein
MVVGLALALVLVLVLVLVLAVFRSEHAATVVAVV